MCGGSVEPTRFRGSQAGVCAKSELLIENSALESQSMKVMTNIKMPPSQNARAYNPFRTSLSTVPKRKRPLLNAQEVESTEESHSQKRKVTVKRSPHR
jgi:hypothetical protein